MKKAFTLPTCKTCVRIFAELQPEAYGCEVVNIKEQGVSAHDLDRMAELAGSYEALFSRRAMKFRAMGLGDKTLTEQDYRELILGEYTFLKRPVFLFPDQVMAGSAKVAVEAAREALTR
jgi:arsenate reductase (glutaredoxin)